MWPEPVERVAVVVRNAGVHARIEELPRGVDTTPGPEVRALAFECDGRPLVALVPGDREPTREQLCCMTMRPALLPPFPYSGSRVLFERSLLANRTVWLRAGSSRHVLGISPAQLARLTRAEVAELIAED